ncbi:endonuclease exonuclease phosphatase family domain containing protein, partial [Musa troglodytarum]
SERAKGFDRWKEGKIIFAATYKYWHDFDAYSGEMTKSKRKRRTPAWCDRILWYGNGIGQLQYIRGESRFSDHGPVCAVFEARVYTESATPVWVQGSPWMRSCLKGTASMGPNQKAFVQCNST